MPKARHSTAGRIKEMRTSPSQSTAPGTIAAAPLAMARSLGATQPVHTPICPTRPQVPIPEDTGGPFISIRKMHVETGPVTAEVRMAGSQILGFFTILPICNMEVPRP